MGLRRAPMHCQGEGGVVRRQIGGLAPPPPRLRGEDETGTKKSRAGSQWWWFGETSLGH